MAKPVKFDVACAVEKYTDRDGNEKTKWRNVGEVIVWYDDQGNQKGMNLTLHHLPGVKYSLFKQEKKQQGNQPAQQVGNTAPRSTGQQQLPPVQGGASVPGNEDEIRVEDILF